MAKRNTVSPKDNWCFRRNATTGMIERYNCNQQITNDPQSGMGWVAKKKCCLPESCCFGCDIVDRLATCVNSINDVDTPSVVPYTSFTLNEFISAVNTAGCGITLINDGSFFVDGVEYTCYGAVSMTYQSETLPYIQCFTLLNSVFCPSLSICFEVYNEQIGAEYFRRIRNSRICLPETGNPADIIDEDTLNNCVRCRSTNPVVPETVTCPISYFGGAADYTTTPIDRNVINELTTAIRVWSDACCAGEAYALLSADPNFVVTDIGPGVLSNGLTGITFKVVVNVGVLANGTYNWNLVVDGGPTCGQLIYNMQTQIIG